MRYSRQSFLVFFLITYSHICVKIDFQWTFSLGYCHVVCIHKQNAATWSGLKNKMYGKVYYSKLQRIFALSTLQKLWTGLVESSWSAVVLHTNLADSRRCQGETGKRSIRQCEMHSQSIQSSVHIIHCPVVYLSANSNFLRFVSSLSQPPKTVINFRGIWNS